MSGIRLSKKYGVNPSVETCVVCGKDMSVVLFGTAYKDANGKTAEAPRQVCLGHVCDDCKGIIKQGGKFFIEVKDGSDHENPYRTGRVVALKEEAAKRIFGNPGNINYLEETPFQQLFGDIPASDPQTD